MREFNASVKILNSSLSVLNTTVEIFAIEELGFPVIRIVAILFLYAFSICL